MKRFYKIIIAVNLFLITSLSHSQTGSSCGSPLNMGLIGTGTTCLSVTTVTNSGSSPCAGAGYGGSGQYNYFRFCTGLTLSCINFNIMQGTASGNFAVTVYSTNCSTLIDAACLGNSGTGATFNTTTPAYNSYQPNTCYFARVWNANAGTYTICANAMAPANDFCNSPTPIGPVPQALNNFCMTSLSPGDPGPGAFCAGSLENNAWYSITTLTNCTFPCSVVVTINNIICSGGGAGFQIGYFTGACGSLNNIGCTSGAGGAVTATITNLSPGQTVLIGLDGNAGANCTYSMSATNTQTVLPITLMDFDVTKNTGFVTANWRTATEKNNDYFTLEKSIDGSVFETVGIVDGAGNSSGTKRYNYTDKNPAYGLSYYRLKQTDYDGTSTYSQMRVIEYLSSGVMGFDLIPNPSGSDGFNVAVNNPAELPFNVVITEVTGKVVYNKDFQISSNAKVNINEGFAKGIYTIAVRPIGEERPIATKKLVVTE